MSAERSQRIERIYHAARERAPAERAAFLEQACAGDDALRQEVESLLAQDSDVRSLLETPAVELAKKMSAADSGQSMIGREFGPYSVVSLLAKGGMGEVYCAHDAKLGRDVAIKILPATFARDSERLARFQREARLLASLNHPNVAAIYGMEESRGVHGLVMELVPGETLANAGALPLVKALTICRQIAEGLEEAHRKNITHRDIKPANIKVTPAGVVKILDLAKALVWAQSEVDLSELPTASGVATEQGRILHSGRPTARL
jgi:serine/threonine protein kinase